MYHLVCRLIVVFIHL